MEKEEIIRYNHIRNYNYKERNYLKAMGKREFGEKFLGFVKETITIHSEDFMKKNIIPIEGSPAKKFIKAIERAGLKGVKF